MSSVSSASSMASFDSPRVSFGKIIAGHARWKPHDEALVCGERRMDWDAFNRAVNRFANGLTRLGIAKGDAVCVLMVNSIESVVAQFGVVKAGGVVVPLSALAAPDSLERMMLDSGAKALVVSAALESLVDGYEAGLEAIVPGGRIADGFQRKGWTSLEAFMAGAPDSEPEMDSGDEDIFNILYSSGTTGEPKGIVHTHYARNMFAMILAINYRIHSGSRTLLTTPLYSNGTWMTMLPTLWAGGTVAIMEAFNPESFLGLVQRERCSHVFMVPTQYIVTMAHPDFGQYDLRSLQVLISAGSPLRQDTKEEILERFPGGLFELYGLTEGVGTTITPEEWEGKIGSVGKPIGATDLKIIDEEGRELPHGEAGEIIGYGPALMRGYHNKPRQTEEATWLDESGRTYLRTGDMGKLDEEGYLYILDRKKDMILSGGLNVYPTDIEEVIGKHGDVMDVTVIGISHEKWGETPLALVIRKDGTELKEEELRDWTNERMGKHQRISAVEFREEFPRNALGKVLKRELRQEYEARV